MRTRLPFVYIFLFSATFLFLQARTCWTYIAPEKFATRCPLIIQGKIIRIEGPYKEHAIIHVDQIFKNEIRNLNIFPGKEFSVQMAPTGKLWENSSDIRYCADTEGIWLVTLNSDTTFSIAEHPVQRQCKSDWKALRKKGTFKKSGKKLYTKGEWLEKVKVRK